EMMKLWSTGENECTPENGVGGHEANINNQVEMRRRKIRLSSEQVDALERSFQEEIELEQQPGVTPDERKNKVKLEPKKKMKLCRELGLHPRQVAIWFQNRRARLKAKKIEHLYDVLKKDFETVSRENQHLQQEVMKLKSKLKDRESMLDSIGYITQVSPTGEDQNKFAAESISTRRVNIQSSNDIQLGGTNNISECNTYLFGEEKFYSTSSLPCWDVSFSHP
ncbi:hypothetical protein MKW94_029998, partial [Papaver nudicaule]|nr:hypothetical protein [Papaver nudicaule]